MNVADKAKTTDGRGDRSTQRTVRWESHPIDIGAYYTPPVCLGRGKLLIIANGQSRRAA